MDMIGAIETLILAFTIGLTGALAPGPTLVATINSSLRRGWTIGPKVAASLQHLGEQFGNEGALVLGDALDAATAQYLNNNRSPSRKVNELDNRGSSFYLTLY